MDQRTLDDFSLEHDHAKPVHPLRALLDNHFFVGKYCCTDGALWIVLMDALLFVPLIMAAFFYPWQALMVGVALLVVSFAGYEGFMLWQRRHPDFHL
jgi:hypothetical protein